MIAGQQYTQDSLPEGDMRFVGVNARLVPSSVPPGYLTSQINGRCTDGNARPRRGFALKPWATPASLNSATAVALTNLQGVGVFKDPDDLKWIVIAANGVMYYTAPGLTARVIGLPFSITGLVVEFVQANDTLLALLGNDTSPIATPDVATAFLPVTTLDNSPSYADQNPQDGTENIPNATWGVYLNGRLVLPNPNLDRSVLSASDYFNITRYQPLLESFAVNPGDGDSVLSAFPVPTSADTPSSAVLVGKDNAIYIISGLDGDLSGLNRQDVTSEYGLPLRKAIWRVGRDLWAVVPGRGVCSLTQTTQNKYQGVDVPVSTDIQPIVERINWAQSAKIRAVKVGNFSYIAVPLDTSTAANAILVYDHLAPAGPDPLNPNKPAGAWAGYDTGISVFDFVPFPIGGVEQLLILTNSGYLGVYEETSVDQTGPATNTEIVHTWKTRGYALRSKIGRIRVSEIDLELKTRNPSYSLTAYLPGVNSTQAIASAKTRDRTKYRRPYNAAPWAASNVNDDHATPGRQDYSVDMTTAINFNTSGVDLSLLQETTESYRVPASVRGQHVQFGGSNTQGACELHGVVISKGEVDKRKGVKL